MINIQEKYAHRIAVYQGVSFEKAVKARLEAEKKYYKEFAPQKHLFQQYGVDLND